MPTFDFACQKCEKVFEWSRPFGSKKMPSCPACKSKKIEKLIAPPVIQFKGSGFYKTDTAGTPPKTTEESKPEKPKTTEKKAEKTEKPNIDKKS